MKREAAEAVQNILKMVPGYTVSEARDFGLFSKSNIHEGV